MDKTIFILQQQKGFKFKFLLWKRYFDTGYTITSYVKYLIALFGISSLNVKDTIFLGLVYAVACLIIGYFWFNREFAELDNEISNYYNLFTREMREMKKNVEKSHLDF